MVGSTPRIPNLKKARSWQKKVTTLKQYLQVGILAILILKLHELEHTAASLGETPQKLKQRSQDPPSGRCASLKQKSHDVQSCISRSQVQSGVSKVVGSCDLQFSMAVVEKQTDGISRMDEH